MISVLVFKLSSLGFSYGYGYNNFLWVVVFSVFFYLIVLKNYYFIIINWIWDGNLQLTIYSIELVIIIVLYLISLSGIIFMYCCIVLLKIFLNCRKLD